MPTVVAYQGLSLHFINEPIVNLWYVDNKRYVDNHNDNKRSDAHY